MTNLEYHKGSFCPYKPLFCQEGYCSECMIYIKMPSLSKQVNPHYVMEQQIAGVGSYSNKAPHLIK